MLTALKIGSKAFVGLGLTLVIGYIIKAEHKIDDAIDAYFGSRK